MKKLKKINPLEQNNARKKLKKAAKKRVQRKTLYPFGFEYRRERK